MFLRCHKRKKNGKLHQYYSVVENRRIANGRVAQKTVLYLGEITNGQEKAWRKTLEVFDVDQNKPVYKYLFATEDESICNDIDAIPVRLSHLKLSHPRAFGDCWLGCQIWDELRLDSFWQKRIDSHKTSIAFSKVLKLLVINRLIKPGSEFYVHQHWFDQTAMDVLLGCDFTVAQKNRLYQCLDKILPYKDELCQHLKERWETLFDISYDVLLYDLTSTYFEGLCEQNPKARFGHSKDRRSDCRQVLIALIVTPDGFPLNYEVLAGNTSEKTTLADLLTEIELRYGKSRRVWLMDRGIPKEETLSLMRNTGVNYLVGTPRKLLDSFEELLLNTPWERARDEVYVKSIRDHDETYVLAKSNARRHKERAMRHRKLRTYLIGLDKLQKNYRDRDRFLKRLGVLLHEAGSCSKCVDLQLPPEGKKVTSTNFKYSFNRRVYRQMIHRDGKYFLRTNQTGKDPIELWEQYMLQTRVEQSFKELKSDLSIRPIHHQLEGRVDAHIFIAFLGYCLQTTLRQKLKTSAPGLTSQAVLKVFSKITLLDVYIPTQDNRTLHLQRYTEPEQEHKILLEKLNLKLPAQAPPKIYSGQAAARQTPL
jgi:transposase